MFVVGTAVVASASVVRGTVVAAVVATSELSTETTVESAMLVSLPRSRSVLRASAPPPNSASEATPVAVIRRAARCRRRCSMRGTRSSFGR